MIPYDHIRLAQMIHEERIREALKRKPYWMYDEAPRAKQPRARIGERVRGALADALYRLAARLEPAPASS